jgi:phosphoribosylformimino-5-aminoimidazole carboxamide ribotide isomerase
MELIPAIDLRHGNVVRLRQGDDAQATVYSDDPVALLESYAGAGVARVHVVDLDAALGEPPQRELVRRMAREGVSLQLGGGLRDRETIANAFEDGCELAVIGSLVARDIDTFLGFAEELSDWLIPALDVARGEVRIAGWKEKAPRNLGDLCARLMGAPCPAVLVTDIERDGMMSGWRPPRGSRRSSPEGSTPWRTSRRRGVSPRSRAWWWEERSTKGRSR